ncbi:hypothetical protein [Iodobacter fluviatilis]|uniref:Uncharacterized protein n=1 Tax=Iodobacter fluviatilis TaxID=537 RepID=A0A377SYF8_9NEIS|nr:hypothetical protein [Iodobacter fluviatilis]TCU81139.1 hypothetical protein EV682_1279 [Iodobacter fluviatilis]STR46023.1 Uncharacterised protein [Iodobacter fluviatilis]
MKRLLMITALLSNGVFAAPFCPWPVPGSETKRFINLTVVQTIEITDEELRIAFGGGNLGSGHEIKLSIKNRADGLKTLQEMSDTARRCDQPSPHNKT